MDILVIPRDEIAALQERSPYFAGLLRFYEVQSVTTQKPFDAEGNLVLDRKAMGLTAQQFQALRKAILDGYVGNPEMRAFLEDYFGMDPSTLNNPTLPAAKTASATRRKPRASAPKQNVWNYNNFYDNNYNNNYNNSNNNIRSNNLVISNNDSNLNVNTQRKIRKAKATYSKYPKSGRKTMKRNYRSRLVVPRPTSRRRV
jgi:hypothetical protein